MILCKHVCLSKYIGKTIFVDFSVFYGILFKPKRPTFKSQVFLYWLQPVDRDGRTQLEVGRPSWSTDVHSVHARIWQVAGRPTRSTVQKALLSGKAPVDRAVDRTQSTALCILASVDRPVDRWHNGLKYDRWSVDRPVDRQVCQTPTASFFQPINLGVWALFLNKIFSGL